MKRALLAAAVPGALLIGNLTTRGLLQHAPPGAATGLAQPLPVVTAWGTFGAQIFAVFAAALVLAAFAGFCYAKALRETAEASWYGPAMWLAAVASAGVAIAWPVVFSSDVYAYAAYGEMARSGIDPYTPVPPSLHAPFVDLARWQWEGTFPPCVYGTWFVAIARAIVALGDANAVRTLLAFRALEVLAWLASAYVFSLLAARWFGDRSRFAVALFALNPLGIWCAAEGHNDALAILFALLAFLTVAYRATSVGGIVFGLSPMLKAAGAVAGVALAVFLASTARRRALEFGAAYLAGISVAAVLLLQPMAPALRSLGAHGVYAPQLSLQSVAGFVPALFVAGLAGIAGIAALARGEGSGALWLALALPLALPNPYPWYMMWVLPIAAAGQGRAGAWLWIATIAASLRYLPDVIGPFGSTWNMLAVIATLVPLGLTAAFLLRPLPRRETATAS